MIGKLRDICRRGLVASLDRRCRFYDLRALPPHKRTARSPIVQFYSSANNIGNYLPVLGIKQLLPFTTDLWCVHDRAIDFEFVNRYYRCGIIGGAGLLHYGFEPFWRRVLEECRIPLIIWGVGGCMPDLARNTPERMGVSQTVVTALARRCDLVNLRDDISARYYNLTDVHIAPCPTVAYLDGFRPPKARARYDYLIALHRDLMPAEEIAATLAAARSLPGRHRCTENRQTPGCGLWDIVQGLYGRSAAVITSRLHGAIIAYALGVPYLAVAYDEKLRAFCRLYGNGLCANSASEIEALADALRTLSLTPPLVTPVYEFGRLAAAWATAHIGGNREAGAREPSWL